MTDVRQLAEQHILEYESHLAHMDEFIARANKASIPAEVHGEFTTLKEKREALADEIAALKRKPLKDWRKEDIPLAGLGPMVMWGIVAQQLEKLVERLGV
jgi:hypothetical protein